MGCFIYSLRYIKIQTFSEFQDGFLFSMWFDICFSIIDAATELREIWWMMMIEHLFEEVTNIFFSETARRKKNLQIVPRRKTKKTSGEFWWKSNKQNTWLFFYIFNRCFVFFFFHTHNFWIGWDLGILIIEKEEVCPKYFFPADMLVVLWRPSSNAMTAKDETLSLSFPSYKTIACIFSSFFNSM